MTHIVKLLFFGFFFFSATLSTASSHQYGEEWGQRARNADEMTRKEVRKFSKLKKKLGKLEAKRGDVSGFQKFLFLFLIPFTLVGGLIKWLVPSLGWGELALAAFGGYAVVVLLAIAILLVALGEGPRG